jgi:O-succinylbenzoic acid--CoA ligase
MGTDLSQCLRQRWGQNWLIGADNSEFWQSLTETIQTLEQHCDQPSLLLIKEETSLTLLAKFFAALTLGHSVLLSNPRWGKQEWALVSYLNPTPWPENLEQVTDLNPQSGDQPDHSDSSSGDIKPEIKKPNACLNQGQASGPSGSAVLIPTGGTSGRMKFVVHSEKTLMASVRGFQAHFQANSVHAYCVLPLFHVSGLMQALRVLVGGGRLALQAYGDLKRSKLLPCPEAGFLSLVPTQLQWLLEQGEPYLTWMKQFRAVLLGGAPAWPGLLAQARLNAIPLALTYGMTETASQVATLLPEQFLAGSCSNGKALPHAQIYVLGSQWQPLGPDQVGQIAITAESLALGYVWPEPVPQFSPLDLTRQSKNQQVSTPITGQKLPPWLRLHEAEKGQRQQFLTDDLGYLDAEGNLYITGRCSTKLITGGENVFPEEVESVLLAVEGVRDVCVVGVPDQRWGQRLCAVLVLKPEVCSFSELALAISPHLAGYKCPKAWIQVETLPRTAQGKVNRQLTLELAETILANYDHYSVP